MATDRTAARKRARPAPVEPQAPDLDVLEDACCPITLEVFRDPVTLAQSGITYERAALEDALARQPGVDPETNKEFDGAPTIVANHTLRRLIASLSAKRDKTVDDEDDAAATNEDAAQHRPMTSSEYDAIVAAAASDTAAPRNERALAARRVAPAAPAPPQIKMPEGVPKACEMRRVGDKAWRWFESQSDAAKAFGVSPVDVSSLVRNAKWASLRGSFEARPAPPRKRERPTKAKAGAAPRKKAKKKLSVDGARQKQNGKWFNSHMFPGREFDDLDAYRAAKRHRLFRG